MKLKNHRQPQLRKYSFNHKTTCVFCFGHTKSLQDATVASNGKKRIPLVSKYNWKKERKISFLQFTLPLPAVLWRFLQGKDHRIFLLNYAHYLSTFSSKMWCNASKRLAGDGSKDLASCAVPVSGEHQQDSSSSSSLVHLLDGTILMFKCRAHPEILYKAHIEF